MRQTSADWWNSSFCVYQLSCVTLRRSVGNFVSVWDDSTKHYKVKIVEGKFVRSQDDTE